MENQQDNQAACTEAPVKSAKQLKKEAEKAAKLEKFKAKQEKQNAAATEAKASDKPKKKEVAAKPKAAEVESKFAS